mmetsp:Transcript_22214/g.68950  ORF Transcript_22214/g.68950 Transcript_22214/m.68950 type:complete len:226 (-) Transcript_22214:267-944(-)
MTTWPGQRMSTTERRLFFSTTTPTATTRMTCTCRRIWSHASAICGSPHRVSASGRPRPAARRAARPWSTRRPRLPLETTLPPASPWNGRNTASGVRWPSWRPSRRRRRKNTTRQRTACSARRRTPCRRRSTKPSPRCGRGTRRRGAAGGSRAFCCINGSPRTSTFRASPTWSPSRPSSRSKRTSRGSSWPLCTSSCSRSSSSSPWCSGWCSRGWCSGASAAASTS